MVPDMLNPSPILRFVRKGVAAQVTGSILVAVLLAAGFGVYYLSSTTSLSSLSSQLSSNRSSLSAAESEASADQSLISSMKSQISSLSSAISAIRCSETGNGSACAAVSTNSTQSPNPNLVNVSGILHVPTGSGRGTLIIDVYDGLNESIVSIAVNFGALTAPFGPMQFNYTGSALSSSNPLPPSKFAEGASTVQGGTQGLYLSYGYSFQVTITLQDGGVLVKSLYVQAGI